MGLLGKTLGGLASKFKDKISQGVQGAKRFAGNVYNTAKQGLIKAKDFVYDNREQIGGALKAISPFITAINPALGMTAATGGSFLQNLNPGPVKEKLKKIVREPYDDEPLNISKRVTMKSDAQLSVEKKRKALFNGPKKKAKLSTQE